MDCSGEHRGFGVNVSFIKSVTLDSWTEVQVNIMKVGGNQRLRDFLLKNGMPVVCGAKAVSLSPNKS